MRACVRACVIACVRARVFRRHSENYTRSSTAADVHIISHAGVRTPGVGVQKGSDLDTYPAYLCGMQGALGAVMAPFMSIATGDAISAAAAHRGCAVQYAVLGVDFLFDAFGAAWLVEANYAPDLCDTKRGTNEIKLQLAKDIYSTFIAPSAGCIVEQQQEQQQEEQEGGVVRREQKEQEAGSGGRTTPSRNSDDAADEAGARGKQSETIAKAIQATVAAAAAESNAFVQCLIDKSNI